MNNDNDFSNAMSRVLTYGIARINNMDMTHEEALELAGVPDTKDDEHCEHCVWDGVAYWDNGQPIAQWITCDTCDWGNQ
jgi:hypothetical protein